MRNTLMLKTAVILLVSMIFALGEPAIIPQPQKIEKDQGTFVLNAGSVIRADSGAEATGEYLAGLLRQATGYPVKVVMATAPKAVKGDIVISRAAAKSDWGAEGYQLVVADAVMIRAPHEAGLFYGVQTLLQLLPPEVYGSKPAADIKWSAPFVTIEDQPRFKWRGLLVDVSRHFLPPDDLKKFIDTMAMHKLNTLHLHLTDDQGWRVEIKKYPLLTELGSIRNESPMPGNRNQGDGKPYGPFFYTQDQLRDLVAYAQARHITIVPEIDMPGHVLALLKGYPELSCTGGPFEVRTRWGIEPDVLCMGNTNGVLFMKDILAEVLEIFPSEFIHIGGDEVPRVRWQKCPKCQALMKAEGFTREAQLQTRFNHQIEDFLHGKGRRLIGWDEILEGGITPDTAIMSWRGIKGGIEAAESGHDVVMSPNTHLYLDHGQTKTADRYEYIRGFSSLKNVYSYEPLPAELPLDKSRHILGSQGNLWAEFIWGIDDLEYKAFPRALALAEVAWSLQNVRNYEDFVGRLKEAQKRLDILGVNYRNVELGDGVNPGVRIGGWQSSQISTTLGPIEWGLTDKVSTAGKLVVTFEYSKGAHGLAIGGVALLEDGKEICRDTHEGFAGYKPRDAAYTLDMPAPKPGARYTLRAQISGAGGTDSRGDVLFVLKPTN